MRAQLSLLAYVASRPSVQGSGSILFVAALTPLLAASLPFWLPILPFFPSSLASFPLLGSPYLPGSRFPRFLSFPALHTAAVTAVSGKVGSTIVLRKGTYYSKQVVLGPEHERLTIQNYNGEEAVISGGVPIIPLAKWQPYNVSANASTAWQMFPGQNNVYGRAKNGTDTADIKFVGTFNSVDDCFAAIKESPKGPFHSFTFHEPGFGGAYVGCQDHIRTASDR